MGSPRMPRAHLLYGERGPGSWTASVNHAVERIQAAAVHPEELFDALVTTASALVDSPASVALLDRGGALLRLAATGDARFALGVPVDTSGTICGQVLATGRPARCRDGRAAAGGPDGRCCLNGRSVLATPLLEGAEVIGVLCLACEQPEWFDEADECAIVVLAAVACRALAALSARGPSTAQLSARRSAPLTVPPTAGPILPAPVLPDPIPSASIEPDSILPDSILPDSILPASILSASILASAMRPVSPVLPASSPLPRTPAPGVPTQPGRVLAGRATPTTTTTAPSTSTAPATTATMARTGGRPAAPARPADRPGLWQWDAESGAVTCAPRVAEILGLPTGVAVTLDVVRELIHRDDLPRFDATVLQQVGLQQAVEGTFRLVTPVGQERTLRAWSEVRLDGDRIRSVFGTVVDITGSQDEELAVQGSLTGLHAVQELTGAGLWEWHPATGELIWSAEMFRLVGLTENDVRPTLAHWHHFVHPEDLERARRLDVAAVEHEGGQVETFRVIGADGVLRHVQSWSIAMRVDGGTRVSGATVDVTRNVRDRMLLERLSATDPVTGLGNRLAFDRRIRELLDDPSRDVALLLLDLDRFKLVNDSLGHQVGDRLLVEVARRLAGVVPSGSITARMGGDEFVVVPRPGIGWLHVRRLAQKIVESLRAPYVLPDSGEMLVCPVSVGVTSTSGREVGAPDLLSEADLALYQAKDSGRDRYVVFDDALKARARARHLAEQGLRAALEEDRLILEYQPIVQLGTGRVVGCEALVRIRAADSNRLLPPDTFIEVAEDTGLVVELDCWVIDTALDVVASWAARPRSAGPPPWLAINVSARSMEHPRVVERLIDGLEERRLPPQLIKVELTEHSFLGTLPGAESALRQLIASGIPVGIDDFGTGYSALAYLPRFDLDFMKIDRSFVASVGDDQRADAVVTAIVDLAHAHGMQVTAEGIENQRQALRLRQIGCDLAQGFHFGHPGEPGLILRG
ncbi:MAG TPA: EAL domain-containing protein [Kineosporiaceae bacterium]|nr:EAL domain-containing protein [Kineosporiaceae bacterium]